MPEMYAIDERRTLVVPGDTEAAVAYAVDHWLAVAKEAIAERGHFFVALSGGSTPKAIFEKLASPEYRDLLPWEKVFLFWSDERCVSPDDKESNYHMAMQAGFSTLPINPKHIFRMQGEADPAEAAVLYNQKIIEVVPGQTFDLVMLGMGEDGHTASLFPKTHGLHVEGEWAIANFIPQKKCWRLTLTFDCINKSRHIAVYVLGAAKKEMFEKVFREPYQPDNYPIQQVGTSLHKALWIASADAVPDFIFDL